MYASLNINKLVIALVLIGCVLVNMSRGQDENPKVDQARSILIKTLTKFNARLFNATRKDRENSIISPISVQSALNQILLGTKQGSKTESELIKAIGYESASLQQVHEAFTTIIDEFKQVSRVTQEARKSKEGAEHRYSSDVQNPSLDMWNLVVSKGLEPLPTYVEDLKKYYRSEVKKNNGSNAQAIADSVNQWGKEAGFGQDIITPGELAGGGDETIHLMSAIKVEAYWFKDFGMTDTKEAFYNYGLRDKLVKDRQVMVLWQEHVGYLEFSESIAKQPPRSNQPQRSPMYSELAKFNFRVIELTLFGGLTFTIMEPLANGTGKELAELEDKLLSSDNLAKVLDYDLPSEFFESFKMPPFKFEDKTDLIAPLRTMGVQLAFDRFQSEIDRLAEKKTCIDKAEHKAVIEVDKKGLKAAAITILRLVPLSAFYSIDPKHAVIKNPFMFVVSYRKIPLFIGHLNHI